MPLGVDESLHPTQCPLNPFALIGVFIERSQGSKAKKSHVFTSRKRRKVLLSCLHQMRHLENQRESAAVNVDVGFSPFFLQCALFSNNLQGQREKISYFSLGNTSMMTLQPAPDVRGEEYVKLWPLNPKSTSTFSYSRDVRCPLALIWSILRSARFNLRYFCCSSNLGLCSVLWCKWKKGNACPPPQKGVKKTRKTHLPFSCVQELLVLHKTVWFRLRWKKR